MKTISCICLFDQKSEQQLRKLMEEISRRCNSQNALAFPPHFSLRNDFKIEESAAHDLTRELQLLAKNYEKFKVMLNGYGFYPWRIIYLKVQKNEPLQKMHEQVMDVVQKYRMPWVDERLMSSQHFTGKQRQYVEEYGYQFAFEFYSPHVTLAGNDMTEELFQTVKSELKNSGGVYEVKMERFVLLDRDANNEIYQEFGLS